MHRVFGIRHHGPGSARSLGKALLQFEPDYLLMEAPQEMDILIPFLSGKKMAPPIAGLIYDAQDSSRAVYFPLAGFSPEYVAIQFAHSRSIPIKAMDLPVSYQLDTVFEDKNAEDPLARLADLAGYSDSERWWEVHIEQIAGSEAVFDALAVMMRQLRNENSSFNGMREAWMRQEIRKVIDGGYQRVAVVCGAWHIPALEDLALFKEKEDKQLLKKGTKIKCEACLVPWSYDQLRFSSGYGAGVISPMWYELLFLYREKATVHWMIRAAKMLRRKDLMASTAEVGDAVRLSESLAGIRNLGLPGLDELKDAALAVLCKGQSVVFDRVANELETGNRIGKIPEEAPTLPIYRDLMLQIKRLRLTAVFNAPESTVRQLDLRKELHRDMSILLHRMVLIEIPWGKKLKEKFYARGSFSEDWSLKWRSGYYLKLIQAGRWGRTIEEAVSGYMGQKIRSEENFVLLASWIDPLIKSGIQDLVPHLLNRMQEVGASILDVEAQMRVVIELIPVRRYGDVRKTDIDVLDWLLADLIPRISIGLIQYVQGIEAEYARILYRIILAHHHGLGFLEDKRLIELWMGCIQKISMGSLSAPLIRGGCFRILAEVGHLNDMEVRARFSFELSVRETGEQLALWLEGFLWGSPQYLIYNPTLVDILDQYIQQLSEREFEQKLPLFRRIFSSYSGIDKRKLFKMAVEETVFEEPVEWDEELKSRVLANLALL
jgi:hypothetical protein